VKFERSAPFRARQTSAFLQMKPSVRWRQA